MPKGMRMYTPDIDTNVPMVEFPPTFVDLQERVEAAFAALGAMDVSEIEVSDVDIVKARDVLAKADPRKPVPREVEQVLTSPGVVVHVKAILDAFDQQVVQSAAQIRTLVTNKLLIESENPNPSVRIRALELLGKISDVGLFTDKSEVTLRHRPTAELEQLLRERLTRTIDLSELPRSVE